MKIGNEKNSLQILLCGLQAHDLRKILREGDERHASEDMGHTLSNVSMETSAHEVKKSRKNNDFIRKQKTPGVKKKRI
jgi:hypothetical protein